MSVRTFMAATMCSLAALLSSCGLLDGAPASDADNDADGAIAVSTCPPDPDFTPASPFGISGEGCDILPFPAQDPDCETVWQLGHRLPDDYAGCDTQSFQSCQEEALLGTWTFRGMYARPGGLIARAKPTGVADARC